MVIDIHLHEKTYSYDSFLDLEELVDKARLMGLDAVCITDHESSELRERAEKLSAESGFPIFVGAEILTFQGDLLVFGLDQLPEEKMSAQHLTEYVLQCGGAVISAHPYRKNNRGLEDHVKTIEGLSGVEGLNGNTPHQLNLQAFHAAKSAGKPVFGGSDAHWVDEVGIFATRFHRWIHNEKELVEAILEGNVTPVYYRHGQYLPFDAADPAHLQAV